MSTTVYFTNVCQWSSD